MQNFRKIDDDISISGQPTVAEIEDLASKGFRTIINLRTSDEPGTLDEEERAVEGLGLSYAPIPVSPETLDDAAVARFSQALESVDSTPALVHCRSAGRAGLMTLLHLALKHGWSINEALQKGAELGDLAPAENSPYRAFFEDYLRRHSAGERVIS